MALIFRPKNNHISTSAFHFHLALCPDLLFFKFCFCLRPPYLYVVFHLLLCHIMYLCHILCHITVGHTAFWCTRSLQTDHHHIIRWTLRRSSDESETDTGWRNRSLVRMMCTPIQIKLHLIRINVWLNYLYGSMLDWYRGSLINKRAKLWFKVVMSCKYWVWPNIGLNYRASIVMVVAVVMVVECSYIANMGIPGGPPPNKTKQTDKHSPVQSSCRTLL